MKFDFSNVDGIVEGGSTAPKDGVYTLECIGDYTSKNDKAMFGTRFFAGKEGGLNLSIVFKFLKDEEGNDVETTHTVDVLENIVTKTGENTKYPNSLFNRINLLGSAMSQAKKDEFMRLFSSYDQWQLVLDPKFQSWFTDAVVGCKVKGVVEAYREPDKSGKLGDDGKVIEYLRYRFKPKTKIVPVVGNATQAKQPAAAQADEAL